MEFVIMNTLAIAATLVILIVIENLIAPSAVFSIMGWFVSFFPWYGKALFVAIILSLTAFLALVFGWVCVGVLALVATYSFPAFHFGAVDYALGDVARQVASNPRDVQEVASIFGWMHGGLVFFIILILIFLAALVFHLVRR
jgi:hypothetical protein